MQSNGATTISNDRIRFIPSLSLCVVQALYVPARPLNELADIEELLACDCVVLHGIEPDFCVRDALAAGLGDKVDRRKDRKSAGGDPRIAAEEGAPDVLALDAVVALKDLRFADD